MTEKEEARELFSKEIVECYFKQFNPIEITFDNLLDDYETIFNIVSKNVEEFVKHD